ncbi:YmaF family protein [Brevibacillus choshinensis]|uniref:YmaF family protein n=1 Tax=Brevibacillus choshinensis TaxID=54911 RepID=UPI002E81C831|nr:YmaF family protein [Brevibacillus choshinensis]
MNDKHSHSLRFLRIADYPSHTHSYDTQTTVSGHHRHRLFGRTSLPQGFEYQHTHYYEGTTSFDDGHITARFSS